MKITTALGDNYEAKQVCVRMTKTLGVEVYYENLSVLGDEISEEELELMAHEHWLDAWGAILKMVGERFPYIDLEILSTDHIEVEVVE